MNTYISIIIFQHLIYYLRIGITIYYCKVISLCGSNENTIIVYFSGIRKPGGKGEARRSCQSPPPVCIMSGVVCWRVDIVQHSLGGGGIVVRCGGPYQRPHTVDRRVCQCRAGETHLHMPDRTFPTQSIHNA